MLFLQRLLISRFRIRYLPWLLLQDPGLSKYNYRRKPETQEAQLCGRVVFVTCKDLRSLIQEVYNIQWRAQAWNHIHSVNFSYSIVFLFFYLLYLFPSIIVPLFLKINAVNQNNYRSN